jgi:hypothetical protein
MNPSGKSYDIYLFLKKRMARERAVYRNRAQLLRLRVFSSGVSGRCATTPAAGDCFPGTYPVGCSIAAPQQGPCRFAHETGG